MKRYETPRMTLLCVEPEQDVFTSGGYNYNSLEDILNRHTDVHDSVDW